MSQTPLLYFFPHVFLKDAVLNQWEFFKKEIDKGPKHLQQWMVANFNGLKQDPKGMLSNTDITLESDTFEMAVGNLTSGGKVIVVKFPVPQQTTEVTFVGIMLGETPRYFTLELHRPDEMEKQMFPEKTNDRYELCEWEKNGTHKLLKGVDRSGLQEFIDELGNLI